MPEVESNGLAPEKCLARLRELDSNREDVIRRQAAMGEKHDSAQRELTRIVEQMKALNTSPQTIQADLAKAVEELRQKTVEYEASLAHHKSKLDEADRALLDLEQKPR
jgi:chromosome segregation ATPase